MSKISQFYVRLATIASFSILCQTPVIVFADRDVWSNTIYADGLGHIYEGSHAMLFDIASDARPEMVVMAYDPPAGPNKFRHREGWNMKRNGETASWSDYIEIGGISDKGEGAGLALINLDSGPRLAKIFLAYAAPSGTDNFTYSTGWTERGKDSSGQQHGNSSYSRLFASPTSSDPTDSRHREMARDNSSAAFQQARADV